MGISIGKEKGNTYLYKLNKSTNELANKPTMKQLIVDCGATKTDWCVVEGKETRTVRTPGFNVLQTEEAMLKSILNHAVEEIGPGVEDVHFYAAGLVGECPVNLGEWFPGARIEYASDMLGAARAVCGRKRGVAAILGTGANTCEYDGEKVLWKVECGGFILGDEGSGAVLGKNFIADYLKEYMPEDLRKEFAAKYQLDYVSIVKNVYGGPAPARFLGGFAPYILSHYKDSEYVRRLVDSNFRSLFERTLRKYDHSLPIGVVGGFGYSCKDIITRLGHAYSVKFSRFLESPLEGLVEYHAL